MRPSTFLGLLIAATSLGLAACSSSGYIKQTQLSEAACIGRAKRVLYDADFSENLAVAPERASVTGRHGGYDATLTCGPEGIVQFDVRGLDPYQIEVYRSSIIGRF